MKTISKIAFLLLLCTAIFVGCKDDPIPDPDPDTDTDTTTTEEAPALTQKVNNFILDAMDIYYYWYTELPSIDTKYENDSKAYFEKLLYTEDKWSFITDDIQALENSFDGIEKSYGWSLGFGTFTNTGSYFAVVEYVYPNTPAADAGLKRGDIIVQLNNGDITEDNYTDLFNGELLTITMGILTDSGIATGQSIQLSSEELTLDPVLITKVIEQDNHKIGYLFYAQYISDFNTSLDTAFEYLQNQQITDLVVDLRYNPGGNTSAAQHFCSSLAPLSVVNNNSTLVTLQWNDKLQKLLEDANQQGDLEIKFSNSVPVKLGLDNIYFLTGSGTASASELSITGLKPYMMSLTTIGDTTYGKYTGSITRKPEDIYVNESYYGEFDNWGIQPIVLQYTNSEGVTDFKDGFAPDILVIDDILGGIPLGDKTEPLLKAAIEDITGNVILAQKKARIKIPYTLFDRGFSKFDANKREVVFDNFNKN